MPYKAKKPRPKKTKESLTEIEISSLRSDAHYAVSEVHLQRNRIDELEKSIWYLIAAVALLSISIMLLKHR